MAFKVPNIFAKRQRREMSLPDNLGFIEKGELQVLKTLGRGTFGHVSLYKKGNSVCVLKEPFSNDAQSCQLFIKEAKLLESLHHPNVVRFYNVVKDTLNYAGEKLGMTFDVSFDFNRFGEEMGPNKC
jgi:serine/threonine protein kinase